MSTSQAAIINPARIFMGLGIPLLLVSMLAMLTLPLPPVMLDFLFTFNIALSLIVLLTAVYSTRPLEFSAFPTVVLIATLLRLALNIASTRIVLLEGHTGTNAAGRVIQAFGDFVVGGNYTVGLVVFAILVIINFVVVTKGAGRVSEVTARFTLDAMPGKQMAIDADLNAGILTHEEARRRREEIGQESDFYGAMDGASKFVRGDAIASVLIVLINIVGGLIVGTAQHGLSIGEAARNYTLLTIGDGLVAQIPSLLLSSATAVIVTRVSSSQDMSGQILGQLFAYWRTLAVSAGVIALLGVIPAMPNSVFLLLAAILATGAWFLYQQTQRPAATSETGTDNQADNEQTDEESRELTWNDVTPIDAIGLDIGYRLIPLVDKEQGGQLMSRVKGVRRKLSTDLGFLIPEVHIRDDLELSPNAYRISLNGVRMTETEVYPDRELAISPGQVYGQLDGIATRDPAFGLDAVWIHPAQHDEAQTLGYTVVDASTVIATHLSNLLHQHAHELLKHEDVQQLLDRFAETAPKLVEELVPKTLSLATVARVLQNLLEEGVPIRDLRTIVATLVEQGARQNDPQSLTASVRQALARFIVQSIVGSSNELPLITLDPGLEKLLQQAAPGQSGTPGIEPGLADRLQRAIARTAERLEAEARPSVLVVTPELRPWMSRWLRPAIRDLHVLSYNEIPDNKQLRIVVTLGEELENDPIQLEQQQSQQQFSGAMVGSN